ncbi:MAG TPA: glutamyl-tRNA reductase, partial [Gammaproteobacteria bacterium]|nr:glutamyl-tRNA reductase [Gammaproteobacteria bacterium]
QMMGEPQIMGQFKSAYEVARKTGTVGPELSLLSRMTLRAAKKIRTHTE